MKRYFTHPQLDDLPLKAIPFRVYSHLLRRAGNNGVCKTKVEEIAKACRLDRKTVFPALTTLENMGLIRRWKKFQGCNHYHVPWPPIVGENGTIEVAETGRQSFRQTGREVILPKESSTEETKMSEETKETPFSVEKDDCFFSSSLSKESQLANLSIPKKKRYPTEEEYDAHLENEQLDQVVNGRPYLWNELTERKWHDWNEKRNKWEPIHDWKKYVQSLNTKMEEASTKSHVGTMRKQRSSQPAIKKQTFAGMHEDIPLV